MNRFKTLIWLSLPLALATLLLAVSAMALPVYAQGGSISGQVFSPVVGSLLPPTGTVVRLFKPGSDVVVGQANVDSNTGAFSFPTVDDGLYVLQAVPPSNSGLTPSRPKTAFVSGSPVTGVRLLLTKPQVFGAVFAPTGSPADATVSVYKLHHKIQQTATSGGRFWLGGLLAGDYTLRATPTGSDPYWNSNPYTLTVTASPNATYTVNLTLTNADLWGAAVDGLGNPVAGAFVAAAQQSGAHRADVSNAGGAWSLGDLPGGEYVLAVIPPSNRPELLAPLPITVTLPGAANPFTFTFQTTQKQAHGTVRTNTGAAVQNALVVARRINRVGLAEALTTITGSYRLNLSPGLWALTVKPVSSTVPGDWIYPGAPAILHFPRDTVPQTRQQDFTVLTADAAVSGTVLLPGGAPPPFKVTVGLYNDEGVGVRTEASTATGAISVAVPYGGYNVVVFPHNPAYFGPVVAPVDVPPGGTADLGTLYLLLRNAVITGTLTGSGGSPATGVPVLAWREGSPGILHTRSGPNGRYALFVSPGEWHVRPAPGPLNPYIYPGDPTVVTVSDGQRLTGVNFTLIPADATIQGTIVDGDGNPVAGASGWITARSTVSATIHNGAPISNSLFAVPVPAGTYNVLARLSPGGDYVSAGARQVTVAAGETANVTLVVQAKDAAIQGALYDPRNLPAGVANVNGIAGAWSDNNWAIGPIAAGLYRFDVAAGLWFLDYRLDPTAGYAKLSRPKSVPVQSGKTRTVNLPVTVKDGLITGTVKSPDGSPLGGALVVAKGFEGDVSNLWLNTLSEGDGRFALPVPNGSYRLGAAIGNPAWLKPGEAVVTVPEGETSGGHVLQFRLPNATLSGTLAVSNAVSGGPAFVWAWSDDGAFTHSVFTVTLAGNQASGPYQLPVISGTTWHVGARFETGSQYWGGEADIAVNAVAAVQDIVLSGPNPKPGPVAVLFNAADEQSLTLADGTEIFIPAGAIPVSGNVLLRVEPISAVPAQTNMRVVNYGYAFLASDETGLPIEEHFNQDVTIRFTYDDTDVLERWLTPAYFSTTTDEWTVPDSYVVDTVANEVTMQIDHFTDFALLDSAPAWAAANPVLTYTFASGRQGWLIFGDANGGSLAPDSIALPNYAAAGGHPGGYLYAVDDVTGGTWFWLRRFTSTVDASAAYSRSLSFELRQTDLDSQYRYPGGDIILEGGATITTSLTYYLPHRPLLHWTPYNVLLHESARWIARRGPFGVPTRATAADFQAVLGNLRSIRIRGEYRDGADTGSLDNVILGDAPPPSLRRVISVGQGGRLAFTTSTTTTLDFPPGMFNLPFTVTVTLTDTSDITNVRSITGSTLLPPAHVFRPVGPAFIIEARRPGGSLLTAFMRPFTITVRYNPAEVSGLQAGSLLVYYRSGNGPWRAITSTLGAGVISVAVDHLTGFAVMGRQSPTYMLYLPLIVRQ